MNARRPQPGRTTAHVQNQSDTFWCSSDKQAYSFPSESQLLHIMTTLLVGTGTSVAVFSNVIEFLATLLLPAAVVLAGVEHAVHGQQQVTHAIC